MKRQERVGLVVIRIASSSPIYALRFSPPLSRITGLSCDKLRIKKVHSFHIFTSRSVFFGCRCSNCVYEIILTISGFYFSHFPGIFNKAQPEMSLPSPLFWDKKTWLSFALTNGMIRIARVPAHPSYNWSDPSLVLRKLVDKMFIGQWLINVTAQRCFIGSMDRTPCIIRL